jgi:THO complex subunit 1
VPKAETLVKKIAEVDLDLDFAATDEEKQALEESKAGKFWRVLRITSKTKLNQFEKLEDGGNLNILVEEQDEAQDTKVEDIQDSEVAGDGSTATNAVDGTEISPRQEAKAPSPVEV